MSQVPRPRLERVERHGVGFWTDLSLTRQCGITVAFSERKGGTSDGPYRSLNLSSRVGDDPARVDANRSVFLGAVDLAALRDRLTTAEEVHGIHVAAVGARDAGAGAFVGGQHGAIPHTDALLTLEKNIPLSLCSADCVLIVLVTPRPAVAVVHAGWRGALASIPGKAVAEICAASQSEPSEVTVYIGAHIRACHYEVNEDLLSQFAEVFGPQVQPQPRHLDLDVAVTTSLKSAGVLACNIARIGVCTADDSGHFFSYRAEGGLTGRHAALVCIR